VGNATEELNMCHTADDEDGHTVSQLYVLRFSGGRGRN